MINIIVAIANNGIIGSNGKLPWHYPEDLKYFKSITMGKKVLMGSKTFQSIIKQLGKPLPGRENIVVTRKKLSYPGVKVVNDLVSYIKQLPKDEELFIIGGRLIYEQTLPFANRLYITSIAKSYEGDVSFPPFDLNQFTLVSSKVSGDLTFQVFERRDERVHS